MKITVYLLFLCACISHSCCKKLPSYIHVCSRNEPKLEQCILDNVEIVKSKLLKGIPELQIPSFNPLIIPEASLKSGDNFVATFKDIHLYYAEEFKVDSVKVNLENFNIDLAIRFPRLRVMSTYTIVGKILILELNGHGPADGNLTDVFGHINIVGTPYQKNGEKHIKLDQGKNFDLNFGKPHFNFANIFGDNKELNDQTNKIINENIDELLIELQPVVNEVIKQFVFSITNHIFEKFSFNELFPNV